VFTNTNKQTCSAAIVFVLLTVVSVSLVNTQTQTQTQTQSSEQQHRCRESGRPLATHPALYQHPGAQTSGKQHWEGMCPSNQGPNGTDQLELPYVSCSLHRCIGYGREF
jgi:hypothetical protein